MFILCFKLLEISDVEVEMALKGGLPGLYMKMTWEYGLSRIYFSFFGLVGLGCKDFFFWGWNEV